MGISLLCVWVANIAIYVLVKRRPKLVADQAMTRVAVPQPSDDSIFNRIKNLRLCRTVFTRQSTESNAETPSARQATDNNQLRNWKKIEVSLAATVRYVVITFSVASLPFVAVVVCWLAFPSLPINLSLLGISLLNGFTHLFTRFLFSNSFMNSIIYSYRSKDFRTELKKYLRCKCHDARHT